MEKPKPLKEAALKWALLHWLPQPDKEVQPPDELTHYAEAEDLSSQREQASMPETGQAPPTGN